MLVLIPIIVLLIVEPCLFQILSPRKQIHILYLSSLYSRLPNSCSPNSPIIVLMSLKVSILEAAVPHEMESLYLSQEQRRGSPLIRSRQRYSLSALILVGCASFFLCYLLEAAFATTSIVQSNPILPDFGTHSTSKILARPENVKIIGLMFYGRAQFTNILEWSVTESIGVSDHH